jgi:phosphosulfolactate synthase
MPEDHTPTTGAFLRSLGVDELPPATSPFDPGYDAATVEAHLAQSGHLMTTLKLSMASWLVAAESAVRKKLAAAKSHGIRTTTGGGPFEIAATQGRLHEYLDLCAEFGFDRVECGEGFTSLPLAPPEICALAADRGLEVQFEVGHKHEGTFGADALGRLVDTGRRWLDAGAVQLVVEARESASGVGLFNENGALDTALAERLVEAFGLDVLVFEAPVKASQFAFLDHFGARVQLANVRLEELLRVEIYRRGLHADAFLNPRLRPDTPA